MKTSEGFTVAPHHVPSSAGDFATLELGMTGALSVRVMPLTSSDLRELATELLACADSLDPANAEGQRVRDYALELAMAADERIAA